jgi:hypothetical protein
MHILTFDRLTRVFGRPATRRVALHVLFGTAIAGTTAEAGTAKQKHKGIRRGKGRRRGKGGASAEAKAKPGNHCVSPSGVDLNELFGISAQIVTGFCTEVGAGERWVPSPSPWFVSPHPFTPKTTPAGFVPAGATPQEDFFAKFAALKIVIDPGTKHEQTVVFPNDGTLFADEFGGSILIIPITLGAVHPLPVGEHEAVVSWVFRAMHCNGIAADAATNCFPAGETAFLRLGFAVVPGHH